MNSIFRVRKFLVLIMAVLLFSRGTQTVYAQSFWSIYDEEEAAKAKAAEEAEKAAEEARKAAEAAAKRKAAEEAAAADSSSTESGASAWFFDTPDTSDSTDVSSIPADSEESESEKVSSKKSKKPVVIKPNPDFAINPGLGANLLQSPYLIGLHVDCDFLVTKMLEPFFFGGGFRTAIGFPRSDFPYTYELADGSKDTPYLMSGNTTGIFGITYSPFNNNIKLLISTRLGLQLSRLLSFSTSAGSDVHAGIFASVVAGVMIHDVEISFTSEYDGVGKFSHGLLCAYRIPINVGGK